MHPSVVRFVFFLLLASAPAVAVALVSCSSSSPSGGVGDAAPDAPSADEAASADAGDSSTEQDGSVFTCSGPAPSLATDVFPILKAHCSGELCHGGTALGAFGGAANAHGQLVNVSATRDTCDAGVLVSPGSLERSYLMNKLTGVCICPGSSPMPRNGTPLSAADIQTIADWICTGAPNN
jgi:hypothetical protein